MNSSRRFGFAGIVLALVAGSMLAWGGREAAYAQQQIAAGSSYGTESVGVVTSAAAATAQQVIAGATGYAFRIKSMSLSSDTAGVIQFTDGSGGTVLFSRYLVANTPYDLTETTFRSGPVTTSGTGLFVIQPLLPSGSQKVTCTVVCAKVPR